MPSSYVSPVRDRLQRRTMRDVDKTATQEGLNPRVIDAFFSSNPDAMRYPSQAKDKALDFARQAGAAQAAVNAPYGSIASRADPYNYGSVASRENPAVFGGAVGNEVRSQGLRRRNPGVRGNSFTGTGSSDAVDRIRESAIKSGYSVMGGDGKMTTDVNDLGSSNRRRDKRNEMSQAFTYSFDGDK